MRFLMPAATRPTLASLARFVPGGFFGRLFRRSRMHGLVFGARTTEPSPIALGHRRVYILPSLHGVTFGLALALMLIGSVNYALSLGYLLTFLLAGMSLVGMVHTFRNLAHLRISAGRCEPVFAGGKADFVVLVDNPTRHDRFSVIAKRFDASTSFDVPAGQTTTAVVSLPAARRGWVHLGRLTLETRFPLGLFRAWGYAFPDLKVLVYPTPDFSDLPAEQAVPERGDAVEAGQGNEDFAGLRPYHPGDSPRHVAWRRAAHDDRLLTKQWTGRGASELWLDWSILPRDMDDETRLSRIAGWVLRAEEAGCQYGLRIPGLEIEPGRGPVHRDRCLKGLALYGMVDPRVENG